MKIRIAVLFLICLTVFSSCTLRPIGGQSDTPVSIDNTSPSESSGNGDTKPEPTPVAEPDTKESRVSFIGCGDNIIYFGTYRDAASKAYEGGRKYNFRPIYQNVESIISAADIAFINQETCTSQSFEVESYPTFNSPVDLTYDVTAVGFDIVNLANNHMLDHGARGLRDSFDNWNARGVSVIGCYEEKDSGRYITYYEKNGIKIGFVSYTYGTNLSEDPAKEGLYAPYLKQSDIAGDVSEARSNSDFVIVSVHWGTENSMNVNDEQRSYAQIMASAGADVIIGHHPHALQPVEWLEGKDGSRCLCVYSLGNFVHEQDHEYQVPGGMISFDIVKRSGGSTAENVQLIPTVCHYPRSFYDNAVYLFKDYTPELADQHAVRTYYGNSMSYDSLKKCITDTIPAEFLPDYMK